MRCIKHPSHFLPNSPTKKKKKTKTESMFSSFTSMIESQILPNTSSLVVTTSITNYNISIFPWLGQGDHHFCSSVILPTSNIFIIFLINPFLLTNSRNLKHPTSYILQSKALHIIFCISPKSLIHRILSAFHR